MKSVVIDLTLTLNPDPNPNPNPYPYIYPNNKYTQDIKQDGISWMKM